MQVNPADVDQFLRGGSAQDVHSIKKKPKVNSLILIDFLPLSRDIHQLAFSTLQIVQCRRIGL